MVVKESPSLEPFVAKGSPPLPFVISAKDPSHITPNDSSTLLHPFMISVQADSHIDSDLAQQLQDGPPMIESLANRKPREAAFCFSGQGDERIDPRRSRCTISWPPSPVVSTCVSE
jgi:hypothetical protein